MEKVERTVEQVVDECRRIPGIDTEVCGSWVWVTGNTYENREKLGKDLNMRFSRKKQAWYYYDGINDKDGRRHGFKGKRSLPQIREKWGSVQVPSITDEEVLQVA